MYEGKNIHYTSGADHKPLCSFSAKVCNQHRLNGYGFCVRHILEDPTAPFRRCAYVAKSSKQMCTQAIPLHEKREYCNNHMQVLGMLPKKEKKQKPPKQPTVQQMPMLPREKLPFKDRVSRFNSSKINCAPPGNDLRRLSKVLKSDVFNAETEDVDDPYAFPDPGGEEKTKTTVNTILPSSSPYHEAPLSVGSQGSHGSKSPGDGGMGVSSIAKLYPELAEKLEKIKPKFDTGNKSKEKGKAKSSRTMNRLQTKIAQNRIKDKLKRNQESNSQSQSPCYNFNSSSSLSAVNHYNFIDRTVPSSSTETSPCQQTPGILNSISHKRNSLPVYIMPQSVNGLPESTTNFNLPGQGFLPQGIPHGMPLELLPGMPNSVPKLPKDFISSEMVLGLNSFPIPQEQIQNHVGSTSLPLSNTVAHLSTQNSVKNKVSPLGGETPKQKNIQENEKFNTMIPSKQQPPPVPPPPSYSQSVALGYPPSVTSLTSMPEIKVEPKPVFGAPQEDIPPPPPYESKPVKTIKSKNSTQTLYGSNVIKDLAEKDITRPHKFKMESDNNAVLKKKFKKDEVLDYYQDIVKRKKENHDLVGAGFDSSDNTSDSDSDDVVSWQPDWFSPSSDEEMLEDEEEAADILRTTKLALLRARLRRRCFQYRKSHKSNNRQQLSKNETTLTLVKASKKEPKATVSIVKKMMHQQNKTVDRFKKRGLERRQCSYKSENEEQCKNPVLPYTNHCLSHIMYNVDQQLFDYCTAKFADNTQCCTPVFDIRHELPLCMEHAMKADNYSKDQDSEYKQKRARKKTKPSALTRPPRKGKKKKNARKPPRPQKPSPPSEPTGITGMPVSVSATTTVKEPPPPPTPSSGGGTSQYTTPQPEESIKNTVSPVTVPPKPQNSPPVAAIGGVQVTSRQEKNSLSELSENMLGGVDNFNTELPLEQASKLLEEPDFQDVFNKLPDEAFNLFGKNGDFNPTSEEFEELERHLAAANMDVSNAQKTLETFDLDLDEEQLKQILFGSNTSTSNSGALGGMINGEDQESINAIARSLSASEQLLPKTTTMSETNIPFTGANMNSFSYSQIPGQVVTPPNKVVTQNSVMYSNNSQYSQFQTPPSYAASHVVNNPPAYAVSQALVNQTPPSYVSQAMVHHTQPSYGVGQGLPNHSYPQHITLQSSQIRPMGSQSNMSGVLQAVSTASDLKLQSKIDSQQNATPMKVVLNQLPELSNKTPTLPVSMQGSLPLPQTLWPITSGQVPPFQNGYPVHGMYLQGTNDMMTNLKYNMNAQHTEHVGQVGEGSAPPHHVTLPPAGTLQGIPGFNHQQFVKSFTASSGKGS